MADPAADVAIVLQPRRLRAPAVLLMLGIMLVFGAALYARGRLSPVIVPDTSGYTEFPFRPLSAALEHYRTPGYPLFLKFAGKVASHWRAVPLLQYVLYCMAVLLFASAFATVARTGKAATCGLWLLGANIVIGPEATVAAVATDFLAAALGLTVVALVLRRAVFEHPSRGSTLLIAGVVAAAWLVRPAMVFLIALIPVLSLALRRVLHAHLPWNRLRRDFVVLMIAGAFPLLAYCSLRAAVVGRFGIVSFGGYNLIGVAGQFLDAQHVKLLPDRMRPLAEAAVERQSALWPADHPGAHEDRLNYARLEARYDDTIWKVYAPIAEERSDGNNAEVNSRLRELATSIIRARSRDYATWLTKASRQAARKLAADFILNPWSLLAALLLISLELAVILRGRHTTAAPSRGTKVLFLIAFLYSVFSLAVVVPVCPPLGRMTDAAGLFLPPLFISACFDRLRRLRSSSVAV
ncbi:MAG: hypothetical protein KF774_00380 [Planctomyces sp.]|nr:hypothetical protein [Planctomyces sp.]